MERTVDTGIPKRIEEGLIMFTVNGDMFGRYAKIPHVLAENGEKFVFKVVGKLQSNTYCSVPLGLATKT